MSRSSSVPKSEAIPGTVEIDITYQTQLRDMFESGLAAAIGPSALAVWMAIKSHADFVTGECFPGVRRLMEVTGQASATVQKAIGTLLEWHLLRISRKVGQRHYYIARERVDVRIGARVVSTIVVDYLPKTMRERLKRLQQASAGDLEAQDVWAEVDVIPGPGFTWDPGAKVLKGTLRADDIPAPGDVPPAPVGDWPAESRGRQQALDWAAKARAENPAKLSRSRVSH